MRDGGWCHVGGNAVCMPGSKGGLASFPFQPISRYWLEYRKRKSGLMYSLHRRPCTCSGTNGIFTTYLR